eukprot:gene43067-52632_t
MGNLAERSKALDSSSSLYGGVGSNPTVVTITFNLFPIFPALTVCLRMLSALLYAPCELDTIVLVRNPWTRLAAGQGCIVLLRAHSSARALGASGQYVAAVRYNNGIYLSTDTGATFSATSAPTSLFWWVSMDSTGQYIGAIVQNGKAYLSSDFGSSWALLSNLPTNKWYTIWLSPIAGRMVAGSGGGGIYYSSDLGQSWAVSNANSAYTWVCASGNSTGELVYMAGWTGQVLASNDGGATWSVSLSTVSSYSSVASDATGQRLVLSQYDGPVSLSSDGGQSW